MEKKMTVVLRACRSFAGRLGKRMDCWRRAWTDLSRGIVLVPGMLRNYGLSCRALETQLAPGMVFPHKSPDICRDGFKMDSWGPEYSVLTTGFLTCTRETMQWVMDWDDADCTRDSGRQAASSSVRACECLEAPSTSTLLEWRGT